MSVINAKLKPYLLIATTVAASVIAFCFPPLPQPDSFHHFADSSGLFGIKNAWNVLTNLPFLIISICGFIQLKRFPSSVGIYLIYAMLFLGVGLTSIGSAIYHSNPKNETLVWDRVPMTIIFMSITCATIAELINEKIGLILLFPLVLLGAESVFWWVFGEENGHGDLRLYFLIQYFPMVLIPLIFVLYYKPSQKPLVSTLIWVVVWYIIAKLLERWDYPIYNFIGISGHALKHLAAGISTWYFIVLYRKFGLSMAGISDKANRPKYAENKFRFGQKEFQTKEFNDGSGMEMYDFGARMYDPQLGLWHNPDPLAEKNRRWSQYNYAYDNPLKFVDPEGMLGESGDDEYVKVKYLLNTKTGAVTMQQVSDDEYDANSGPGDPIKAKDIKKIFGNGHSGIAYSAEFFVDMPMAPYRGIKLVPATDVGHSYVRLTKVNDDGSLTSVTFGFYPAGGGGRPWGNWANGSTFKDDEGHPWSVELQKPISVYDFNRLLNLVALWEPLKYNLESSNCSTFAVVAASVAGISFKDAVGCWPSFDPATINRGGADVGYNPASLGSSIIEGKYLNLNTGDKFGISRFYSPRDVSAIHAWQNVYMKPIKW